MQILFLAPLLVSAHLACRRVFRMFSSWGRSGGMRPSLLPFPTPETSQGRRTASELLQWDLKYT